MDASPVIAPGCIGGGVTVILIVRPVLAPQELLATTVKLPLLVGTSVQLVPVPLGVPPPLYVQV